MSENKLQPSDADIVEFIKSVPNKGRSEDGLALLDLFNQALDLKPRLWGDSIVGYGIYHYKYKSGREGDYFLTGFSPRKANMTVYIMPGFGQYSSQLNALGKHKHSVSCLYLGRLSGIDQTVLMDMVTHSVARMKDMYPWQA